MTDPNQDTQAAPPPAAGTDFTGSFAGGHGPYADYTPHARGGLGEVYKAADPSLHRTVAVKTIQDRHADLPASRRRFLFEAEITARLEHPGVVPVYSLFRDGRDRPAYAMRFVQGQTLEAAVAAYHAGPPDAVAFRRLLQSFLQVCQTVAYAHSRGVIHRDLKPQNVMLGQFGETLVIDWGLAKVVGRPAGEASDAGDETLEPASGGSGTDGTAMGSAVGTPAFMSPEQAAGRWDVIAQPSDVYGLGAVLYVVLTGRPPLDRGNWPEMQQKIQRGDFPPPRQANATVPRPLDSICVKAMTLDPAGRYPSAAALAADIEHWLADEPMTAYREPLPARGRRWMRGHRTLVTAAMVALAVGAVAAVGGLALLSQTNRQVAAERNAARDSADEARAVNDFLTDDLLGQADPDVNGADKKVTVEQVLAKAAAALDGNPKFADKPAVEATLRLTIGKTYFKLGDLPQAESQLRRAVDLRQQHLGPDAAPTLVAREALADFLLRGPAKAPEALELARGTWPARRRVLGPDHRDTLDSLDTYAQALQDTGNIPEAIERYQECLAGRKVTLGPADGDTLTSMANLASLLMEHGRPQEAVVLLKEVIDQRARTGYTVEWPMPIYNLAGAMIVAGELTQADRLLAENVERCGDQFKRDGNLYNRLRAYQVRCWVEQGRAEDGLRVGLEVLTARRKLYPAGHRLIGSLLVDLGRSEVKVGRAADAEPHLREAVQILPTSGLPEYFTGWAECWLAASLAAQGRFPEAEPHAVTAERILRTSPMTPARHYRLAVEQLAALYRGLGRADNADEWAAAVARLPAAMPTK